ncbi:MAG: BrnA antitoxin family protein [Brevundimonas aurantiaca]|uniref:BrnA antitoxin family protein n=1 Tax=Brevundimonas aurantiaca TaxID=74316 RepID=UPI00391DDAC0
MAKNSRIIEPEWVDPDDAPAWTPDVFDRAQITKGDTVIKAATGTLKRGRPKAEVTKEQVSLRLDRDVLAKWRATGPGWQGRINELLRKTAGV